MRGGGGEGREASGQAQHRCLKCCPRTQTQLACAFVNAGKTFLELFNSVLFLSALEIPDGQITTHACTCAHISVTMSLFTHWILASRSLNTASWVSPRSASSLR